MYESELWNKIKIIHDTYERAISVTCRFRAPTHCKEFAYNSDSQLILGCQSPCLAVWEWGVCLAVLKWGCQWQCLVQSARDRLQAEEQEPRQAAEWTAALAHHPDKMVVCFNLELSSWWQAPDQFWSLNYVPYASLAWLWPRVVVGWAELGPATSIGSRPGRTVLWPSWSPAAKHCISHTISL